MSPGYSFLCGRGRILFSLAEAVIPLFASREIILQILITKDKFENLVTNWSGAGSPIYQDTRSPFLSFSRYVS